MKQKVKKKLLKQRKLKEPKIKRVGDMDVDENEPEKSAGQITAHKLKELQTAEWKKMKSEVAQLKKERKGIKKKGNKDCKKKLSQKIKELIKTLTEKHQKERAQLGIVSENPADDEMSVGDDDKDDDNI